MKYIKYSRCYKYKLTASESYELGEDWNSITVNSQYATLHKGILVVARNYAWDGASWPAIDTKTFMRGSLIHDALYQLIREGHLTSTWKTKSDEALRDICLKDGMAKWRAAYVYFFVSKFGHGSSRLKKRETIVYCV